MRLLGGLRSDWESIAQWQFKLNQDTAAVTGSYFIAARTGYCYTRLLARSPGWAYADLEYNDICFALLSGDQATLDLFFGVQYPVKTPAEASSWMVHCMRHCLQGNDVALAELANVCPHEDFQSAADFFKAMLAGNAEICTWTLFELLEEQKKEHGAGTGELPSTLGCALAKLAKRRGLILEAGHVMLPSALLEEVAGVEYPDCDFLQLYYG